MEKEFTLDELSGFLINGIEFVKLENVYIEDTFDEMMNYIEGRFTTVFVKKSEIKIQNYEKI